MVDDALIHTAPTDLVGVVRIGKRAYATSLIWNVAQEQRTLLTEARESATRLGADVFCLYVAQADGTLQYATGETFMEHKPGLPALAAAVAAASMGSVYGVWRTDDDCWVLLGIRSDAAVVYDKAFRTEDQARNEFYEGLRVEPWEEIVCPATWQVSGAKQAGSLAERFNKATVKLRPLHRNWSRTLALPAAVVGLVVGGYWVVHWVVQWLAPPPPPVVYAPVRIPPMPWSDAPLPVAVLRSCVESLLTARTAAVQIPGWSVTQGQCDGKTVSYDMTRQGGSENWITPFAARIAGTPTVSKLQANQATLSWQLGKLPAYTDAQSHTGVKLEAAQNYLHTQFVELGLDMTMTPGQDTPFWRSFNYQLTTQHMPDMFAPLLSKIPASVINRVSLDTSNQTWSVSGEVFERLPPPPPQATSQP